MSTLTPDAARRLARLAGFNYLLIFIFAMAANMGVVMGLEVSGDPAATFDNILGQVGALRLAAAAFMVVLVADVIISAALYFVLRPAGARLSLIAALFRLVYTAMFSAVALNFVEILTVIEAGELIPRVEAASRVYLALNEFQMGFAVSLIFFAVHLVLLGVLFMRAPYLPGVLGGLLVLSGLGYAADGFGQLLFASYGPFAVPMMFAVLVPAIIGEGALCLWLLIRGLNPSKWPVEEA